MKFNTNKSPIPVEVKFRSINFDDIENGMIFDFKERRSNQFLGHRNLMLDKQTRKYFPLSAVGTRVGIAPFNPQNQDFDYAIVEGYFQETEIKTQIFI